MHQNSIKYSIHTIYFLREHKDIKNWRYLMNENNEQKYTSAGTNIDEVKRKNAASGMSYNEVKEILAETGGYGTAMFSDTNRAEVKSKIRSQ